jgi:proton glutamate symport protein
VRRLSLTAWIFIGMAAGVAFGAAAPGPAQELAPLGTVFLRLIRSIVAPLIFATLVAGIAGSGDLKGMGRIGFKAFLYFQAVTAAALVVGLLAANIARPGDGLRLDAAGADVVPQAQLTFGGVLEQIFPASVVDSMARGDVLQIVVFALLFGAACAAVGEKARPVVAFCESLAEVMFRYTKYVMYLAPLGVGAAIAAAVGSKSVSVLFGMGKLVLTVYAAQAVFMVLVLGGAAAIARAPLGRLVRAVRTPFLIGYSTASSQASLPAAIENTVRFGVPKHIVGFVLPAGCSFNLNGSTLYLALATVFIAQAGGVELGIGQQLLILATLMVTSKGVAGVPRASIVILAATLSAFGLPMEGLAVVLGVDVLLDMARTAVNITGNCVACAVVARWEGIELREPAAYAQSQDG